MAPAFWLGGSRCAPRSASPQRNGGERVSAALNSCKWCFAEVITSIAPYMVQYFLKKLPVSHVLQNIIGRHADALIMNLSIKTRGIFYGPFITFPGLGDADKDAFSEGDEGILKARQDSRYDRVERKRTMDGGASWQTMASVRDVERRQSEQFQSSESLIAAGRLREGAGAVLGLVRRRHAHAGAPTPLAASTRIPHPRASPPA